MRDRDARGVGSMVLGAVVWERKDDWLGYLSSGNLWEMLVLATIVGIGTFSFPRLIYIIVSVVLRQEGADRDEVFVK